MNARQKALVIARLQRGLAEIDEAFKAASYANTRQEMDFAKSLRDTKKRIADAIGMLSDRPKMTLAELMS